MLINIIIGLFGLGIVVFFHEAGHFLAAKAFGITVHTFSIGWGKKLYSFKRGETEYCISMLPLGGYCQLKGEEVLKQAIEKNSDHIDSEPGSLYSVSPWKRILVFFAGPFMNLLFSIVVLSIIWYAGFTYFSPGSRIILASEYVSENETFPADMAGLKTGDKILKLGNKEIVNYQEIRESIALNPEKEINVTADRNGNIVHLTVRPDINRSTGGGRIGIYPWIDPVVSKVIPGSPADIAGLKQGDKIVEFAGAPVTNQMDIYTLLETHPEKVALTYLRDNASYNVNLFLDYDETGKTDPGFIFDIMKFSTPDYTFPGAVKKGIKESFTTLFVSIKGLKTLFMGVDINKAVSGPIRITYMVGEVATQAFSESIKQGFINFFQFLSLISIALFFMNLLPIPALDGGQIVFAAGEIIMRKNFRPKVIYRYQIVGFVFIFFLLFFSLFNDIIFLIRK